MSHKPSIVRARYILTLLRVARSGEDHEAIRLVTALSSEYRLPNTPADLVPFEHATIEAVEKLAAGLASTDKNHSVLWERAAAAATEWLNAAD